MNFNNLSGVEHARNQEYVHRVNMEKGWFDKPVSFLECMALLMTEVVEAQEAYEDEGLITGWIAGKQLASEFADCYIRLLDDCSRFSTDLGITIDIYKHTYEHDKAFGFVGVTMNLMKRIRAIIEAYRVEGLKGHNGIGPDTRKCLAHFFLQLQDTCDEFGVNLMPAFDTKMAVNSARPYRHGGKHA